MSLEIIQSSINDLTARVQRLERLRTRTTRGHASQRRAAEYIGKSREWLRQRELCGNGPPRNPDGTYPYDGLDAFVEQDTT
jgi:hypothetical protein